jgi:hypothetical protein
MKHETWVKKILIAEIKNWFDRNKRYDLQEASIKSRFEVLDRAEYMSIGEHGATVWLPDGHMSGTWRSTQIAFLLAGIPTIDSRRATLEVKSIIIKNNDGLTGLLSQRELLQKNGCKFINC